MNLSDAVASFLADRRTKGTKATTVRNEKQVLETLLADVGNIQVHNLRPQHMDAFWARRTTWGPGTMNRARGELNVFFAWCRVRGHMPRDLDPLEGSRKIRVPPRDRVTIPQSQFSTFIAGLDDARTRAAVAIGLYTFMRLSEIQDLRWQDVDLDSGTVAVYRRKTETLDSLPICSELSEELRRWRLAYATKVGETVKPNWFVIPGYPNGGNRHGIKGHKGFRVTEDLPYLPHKRSSLGTSLRVALKDADYYRPMEGGHTLRRSGAIALYDQLTSVGHDRAIRICQAMLGHSSVRTTEVYLRLDLDRKLRHDLLSNKQMFPEKRGRVVSLRGEPDGQADASAV